jgi:hypothetical protein
MVAINLDQLLIIYPCIIDKFIKEKKFQSAQKVLGEFNRRIQEEKLNKVLDLNF